MSYRPSFTKEVVASKFNELVHSTIGRYPNEIKPEMDFVNDLHVDSLDIISIIMDAESEFDIVIPEDVSEKIRTVGDFVSSIESLLKTEKRLIEE